MATILLVGTFCGLEPRPGFFATAPSTDTILWKGFEENGHKVIGLDVLGKNHKMLVVMTEQILKDNKIDFAIFGNVFGMLRNSAPSMSKLIKAAGAKMVMWHGDMRDRPEESVIKYLKYADFFFLTCGGRRLQEYKDRSGVPVAAFLFNPAMSFDSVKRGGEQYDILFAGCPGPQGGLEKVDGLRDAIMEDLPTFAGRHSYNLFTPGYKEDRIQGTEYIAAIKASKIVVGVNRYTGPDKYTSDRMSMSMANGAFYLCNVNPGLDELFKHDKHCVFFNSKGAFFASLKYYLEAPDEKLDKIRLAGQKHILETFGYKRVAQYIADIVLEGKTSIEWAEIYA